MQLQEALQGFLLQLCADGRSPHTIGQYRRHVGTLIDWVATTGAGSDVTDLAPDLLARFFANGAAKNSCRGGPKKAVSLNAMRTSIRCFAAHLHDAGLVTANPARLLRRAQCAQPASKALHADEQERLLEVLAAATGPEAARDRMLVGLLFAGSNPVAPTNFISCRSHTCVVKLTGNQQPSRLARDLHPDRSRPPGWLPPSCYRRTV